MASVRFEGCEWFNGTWSECHAYLEASFAGLDVYAERFWGFRDSNDQVVAECMSLRSFEALCNGAIGLEAYAELRSG